MSAVDLRPNRLEAAKKEIKEFVALEAPGSHRHYHVCRQGFHPSAPLNGFGTGELGPWMRSIWDFSATEPILVMP